MTLSFYKIYPQTTPPHYNFLPPDYPLSSFKVTPTTRWQLPSTTKWKT
ncbi:hypothetical protein MEY_01413 [Candida albicans 19F]|nr:hypothetical protein MEY_01413 [Candida albicans 19F]